MFHLLYMRQYSVLIGRNEKEKAMSISSTNNRLRFNTISCKMSELIEFYGALLEDSASMDEHCKFTLYSSILIRTVSSDNLKRSCSKVQSFGTYSEVILITSIIKALCFPECKFYFTPDFADPMTGKHYI